MKFYIVFLVTLTVFPSNAQTFVNGGFEDWPDSCSVNTAPSGWTIFSPPGGPNQRGLYCEGSIIPYEGNSYMSLQWSSGSGFIHDGASQIISDLVVAQSYAVSFYAIPCDYSWYHEPINVLVFLDSVLVYVTPELQENDPWTPFSLDFIASDTAIKISFQALEFDQGSSSFASLGIDAVSISSTAETSENLRTRMIVYPNPTSDLLFISEIQSSADQLSILDLNGKIVLTTTIQKNGIDVSSLAPGFYYICLDGNHADMIPFVKQN